MTLASFILAVATAYLAALLFFPALRLETRKRTAALIGSGALIAVSPLWIPLYMRSVRFFAALNAIALLVKLYDLHLAAGQSIRPRFGAFGAFLPNLFSVVWKKLAGEPRPTLHQNLVHLAQASWKTVIAVAFSVWLFKRNWQGVPFILEHCAKAMAVFVALIPLSALGATLWRLAGGRARDFMDATLLAATPAQFWRRYNRPAQQFLYEDVFKPVGGFRSPVRATLVTFVVSALVHEYVFGITLGRVQGYQTVFFLLQGLAVAASVRWRPKGRRLWLWIGITLVFNLATSVFFFASINGVFPFYSQALPKWLAQW
jgi:hypothetical protein